MSEPTDPVTELCAWRDNEWDRLSVWGVAVPTESGRQTVTTGEISQTVLSTGRVCANLLAFALQFHHHRRSVADSSGENHHHDDSYVVGVVEFRPESFDIDIRRRTELHLDAYGELTRSDEAKVSKR